MLPRGLSGLHATAYGLSVHHLPTGYGVTAMPSSPVPQMALSRLNWELHQRPVRVTLFQVLTIAMHRYPGNSHPDRRTGTGLALTWILGDTVAW